MTPDQKQQFKKMTDVQKAEGLRRCGWKPAGDGDGPLDESEWWPPARFYDVIDMTCSFERAIEVMFGQEMDSA